uniref:SANT_DAMP1_like domain-containing protein n=1 Tax=Panagrellus redivivus TaxID=6233 RepID=A0A7E4V7I9_PANRE
MAATPTAKPEPKVEDPEAEASEAPLTFSVGDPGFSHPDSNLHIRDIRVYGKYFFKHSDSTFRGIPFLKKLLPADQEFPAKYLLTDKAFKPHKWHRYTFKRDADGLEIEKWRQIDGEDDEEVHRYGERKIDVSVQMIQTLTRSEHDAMNRGSYLWSWEETLYLIEMCKRYNLRYALISDRYNFEDRQLRCITEVKARIHYIYNCLCILRKQPELCVDYNPTEDKFNRMRVKRARAWKPEDINIINELKQKVRDFPMKLYKKKAEMDAAAAAAKAAAALAEQAASTAASVGAGLVSSARSSSSHPPSRLPSVTRAVARTNTEVVTDWNKKLDSALDTSILRFFNKDALGPHMQSQEFRLLSNVNIKKKANIDFVIDQLETQTGMTMTTFTKEVSDLYTKLSLNINKVTELKNVFTAAQAELTALAKELRDKTGEEFDISDVHPPRRKFDNGDPSLLAHIESPKNPNAIVTRKR